MAKTSTKLGDKEKANIRQKQFLSIFKQEPNDEVPAHDKYWSESLQYTCYRWNDLEGNTDAKFKQIMQTWWNASTISRPCI